MSCFIELFKTPLFLPALDQRNAQVIGRKSFKTFSALQPLKYFDCLFKFPAKHINLCTQKKLVITNFFRDITGDFFDGAQRISGIIFLHKDTRQAICRLIAYRLLNVAFENGLDGSSGALVHPVGQLKIAHGKIGIVDLKVQRIESRVIQSVELPQLSIQPCDRIEVLTLLGVVERLTKIEILRSYMRWIITCKG